MKKASDSEVSAFPLCFKCTVL